MVVTQVQTIDIADQAITAAKVSPSIYQRDDFTVGTASGNYTGSTTVFNLNFSYQTGTESMFVYQDGVLMTITADYAETNSTTITFNSARTVGSKISFVTLVAGAVATSVVEVRENYVAGTVSGNYTGSLTQFDTTSSYVVNGVNLLVYLDGALQVPGASNDYVENSSTRITFNTALTAGQLVSLVFKQTTSGSNAQSVNGFSASATPTASMISPLDSTAKMNSITLPYAITKYRRPVLQWQSATQVNVQDQIVTGTTGDCTVLFPDGKLITVNNTTQTAFVITRNAVLSGSKQSGLRTGSEATNTWYALYAVRATDNDNTWVTVGDTVFPVNSSISTLNTNFGTDKWIYLGTIRNGDNASLTGDILAFTMVGNMVYFTNSAAGNARSSNNCGIRFATTGVTVSTLVYTYASGSGTTNIPSNVDIAQYTGNWGNVGVQLLDSANTRIKAYAAGDAVNGGTLRIWCEAGFGFRINSAGANVLMDIFLGGFMDSALGSGPNPLV